MRKYQVVPYGAFKYAILYQTNPVAQWEYVDAPNSLWDRKTVTFDSEEEACAYIDKHVPGYFKGKHGFFKDKHVSKHYTANFSNQFVEQGTKGRCIREKHVNEVGYLLLVNFGPVSIWCIERDLIEVVE